MNSGFKDSFSNKSAWCRKRTDLERRLIILSFVISLIALAFFIALCVTAHKMNNGEDDEICTSPGCIHAASTAIKYIDESVDPCDNFYKFACGSFIENTNIPEDKTSVMSFVTIRDQIRDQLKLIIEEPVSPKSIKPYRLLKKVYDICMNTTAIDLESVPTVLKTLKDVGGWPLLEGSKWDDSRFDWKQLVYKLREIVSGTGYFVSVYIGTDDKNSTKRIIHVDEGSLGMSREYLVKGMDEKLVKAYYEYMVDISVLFGANKNSALKELKETLELEMAIANISLPKEELRNSTALYNPMKVQDLITKYPFIPWVEYINKVLLVPNITIDEDEDIIVTVPKYLDKIEEVIRRTPKRVQANYIMRRVALGSVYYLTDEFRNRQLKYMKIVTGQSERQARWKECTSTASGTLSLATGASYVKKYFKQDAKKKAEEMVADIRAEFVKILKKVDWMDRITKQNALEKASSMIAYIGYPDELLEEEKLEKFYADLDIDSDNYVYAMRSVSKFFTDYYTKKLREPVNKTEWLRHAYPTVVNAFYSSTQNSIEFPAGILQGVFFDSDRPNYMNYGAIGYVIGHEITHGFDDQGRQFDKDGNLNEWWEEETKTAFLEKAKCIIHQYGNYTVLETGQNLNGINTQGENIADNGGIKEAYLAYQSWVERNNPEPKLPGLKYSPNQMFWISAAQTWCIKQRKEVLKLQVTTGYHSPSQFRVIGPFGNSEYFSKDFDCPVGSKMNPVDKCNVW